MSYKIVDYTLDVERVKKANTKNISCFSSESLNTNSYKNNLISELEDNFKISNIEELISNIFDINKNGNDNAELFIMDLNALEDEIENKLEEERMMKAKLEEQANAQREEAQAQRP